MQRIMVIDDEPSIRRSRPPVSHHSDLIDTTEMYLRTVYELEEEGVVPLRARIAERLGQSGPTGDTAAV